MDFIIFKNPNLRYRSEEFGGVAKILLKLFMLSKEQYKLIETLKSTRVYSDLNAIEQKIADSLIEQGLLMKVDLEKAKKLGFKC
jgi:hypothetical protein